MSSIALDEHNRKIIVGVDESDRSRDAVALAALLARGSDAELVLVCAYPYDDVPGRGSKTGYRQYLREDAERALERATAGMDELPPLRKRAIAELSPAKCIQNVAGQATLHGVDAQVHQVFFGPGQSPQESHRTVTRAARFVFRANGRDAISPWERLWFRREAGPFSYKHSTLPTKHPV